MIIARALYDNPDIIVFDEPTTALDVTTQIEVLAAIKDVISEKNTAAIYITHDLAVVSQVTEKIAVLYAGKIVEIGSTQAIINDPKHPYTTALLSAVPKVSQEGALESIEGSVPNLVHPPSGCRFHPRCPIAEAQCAAVAPTLEDLDGHHQVACLLLAEGA